MPFFWRLFPSFIVLAIFACGIMVIDATRAMRGFHMRATQTDLTARGELFESLVRPLAASDPGGIDSICVILGRRTRTRFTVIAPDGRVLGDSHEDPSSMDNHADRPEIIAAMAGDTGIAVRHSATLNREMMYVALPVSTTDDGRERAVVRASMALVSIFGAFREVPIRIMYAGLIVVLLATVASLLASRRLSRPLEQIKLAAERFADGDFSARLPLTGDLETARLAASMNAMAAQLDERIRTINKQRNEQETILASMVEGVIAVDRGEKILLVNQAAAHILGSEPETIQGRLVQEQIRHPGMQRCITAALASEEQIEREIQFSIAGAPERALQVVGTTLCYPDGAPRGALVVVHDITRLKRLEHVRRDFVANVSHELRTPLTSIKGFVETLLDGAMDDAARRGRFLNIIAKHVARVTTIVDDLMMLSRLEREQERELELVSTGVDAIVKEALEVCEIKARERHIAVEQHGAAGMMAPVNGSLIEQALINLIDNAVKYSGPDTTVRIECEQDGAEVRIAVRDQGPGMSADHLPRLFERFYRVDRARSRTLGGTGLGLAIVKHIMALHRGSVTVVSAPGKGSTFTLHIPLQHEHKETA